MPAVSCEGLEMRSRKFGLGSRRSGFYWRKPLNWRSKAASVGGLPMLGAGNSPSQRKAYTAGSFLNMRVYRNPGRIKIGPKGTLMLGLTA